MRRFLLVLLALLLLCGIALAHSGRTDSSGGHWDHSTGTYHYHNGGGSSSGSKSSSGSSSSGVSSGKPSKLVTTGSVNMREGAGTSYDIITTLPEGTTLSYGGKVSGNWYYVKYGLQYGWIHQNYARVTAWESSSSYSSIVSEALKEYADKLAAQIPTPSPKPKSWLTKETEEWNVITWLMFIISIPAMLFVIILIGSLIFVAPFIKIKEVIEERKNTKR